MDITQFKILLERKMMSKKEIHIYLLILAASAFLLNVRDLPSNWNATHWLFTYDFGFAKRSLIGEVYSWVVIEPSVINIGFTYLIASFFVVTLLLFLFNRLSVTAFAEGDASHLHSLYFIVFFCMALSSPSFIQQVLFDAGRFDVFGWLLLLGATISIVRTSRAVSFVCMLVASALAIMIHEALVVWIFPSMVAIWYWYHGKVLADLRAPLVAAVFLFVVTLVTISSSFQDSMTFEEARTFLENRSQGNFGVSETSLAVQFRSVADNLEYTAERSWSVVRLFSLFIGLTFVCVCLIAFLLIFGSINPKPKLMLFVFLASFLAPLLLFAFGHDQGRWLSMICANIIIAHSCLLVRLRDVPLGRLYYSILLLIFILMLNLQLGPFGVTRVFPEATIWEVSRYLS